MDIEDEAEIQPQVDVVDPALRAHIYSLVTALGGSSSSDDGTYELGDDALACLKDLKRWLQGYDEKLNRFDVARCMAEANLVAGDILPILANLSTLRIDDSSKLRLGLACVEILVPLTWPLERNDINMTVNHHRHMAYLQYAQLRYKAEILQHKSHAVLDACIRVALPSMAAPKKDRGPRDEGIIRLVLFLARNVARLERIDSDGSENLQDVSRSTTITTFEQQHVFRLLLTIASGLGKGFDVQDVMILECLFYLLRGLDAKEVFMSQKEQVSKSHDELRAVLEAEKGLKRAAAKTAPTRHNRFGTTIWLDKGSGSRAVVSGQAPLLSNENSLKKMDSEKKWNRVKPREKIDASYTELNRSATLTSIAKKSLRLFVEEFLDSCFNPFFDHLRKAMERDSDRIMSDTHPRQYCYVMAWFLQAQRERKAAAKPDAKTSPDTQIHDFSLIAAVLNQETSILLTKYMNESLELKAWGDIQAGCLCLTQILLTVQDMAASQKEDDQDDAENIQNRLFYEESSQEMIVRLVRNYERQPLQYLDAVTELAFVHLRMLEKYSKRNATMVIRAKRQRTRKTQDAAADNDDSGDENVEAQSRQTVAERQFNFTNFESKYLSQTAVNTFVTLLGFYRELNHTQIKRAITFLHRIFVKREMEMLLFRIDIVELLNRIAKDSTGLPTSHKAYVEVHQFVKYFSKRLTSKLKDRPSLIVELLFSKINRTVHYLQTGQKVQKGPIKPKRVAELEVKPGYSHKEQVGIVVSALAEGEGEGQDILKWLESILRTAIDERRAWEAADAAEAAEEALAKAAQVAEKGDGAEGAEELMDTERPKRTVQYPVIDLQPKQDGHKKALGSDQKVILLLNLLGCKRTNNETDDAEASWIIPPETSTEKLEEMLQTLLSYIANPKTVEDGSSLLDLLRKKKKSRQKRFATSDEENVDNEFAPNLKGLTRKSDHEKKKKGRKRNRGGDQELLELDDSEAEAKAEMRRKKNAEKRGKIKSALFIRDSDDESDEERDKEFFEREARLRKEALERAVEAAMENTTLESDDEERVPKRRKPITYIDESGDDGNSDEEPASETKKAKPAGSRSRVRSTLFMDSDEDSDDDEEEKKQKDSVDEDEEIGDASDPSDDE